MSEITLTNPADLQKLKTMIIEASNSKLRIEAERDNIKAIKERAKDELEIKPKQFNRLLSTYHSQNFNQVITETEEFKEAYERVFGVPEED